MRNDDLAATSQTFQAGFSLRALLAIIGVICVLLAVVAGEQVSTAVATVGTLAGYLIVGWLAQRVAVEAWLTIHDAWSAGDATKLIRLYRWVPVVALLSTILIVAIVVANHVRQESTRHAGSAVSWGGLLIPALWLCTGLRRWRATKEAT